MADFNPASVLSGYKPADTLYSRFNLTGKNYLQKSLVILQFTLASFLIIATLVIYAQFNFLTTEKLGYDDSNLVLVNKDQVRHGEAAVFRNELMKDEDIVDVAAKNGGNWVTAAKTNNDSIIQFQYVTVNESYIPLLKIPIVQGRNFSAAYFNDSINSVLVNEEFVKKAGWKKLIGQVVNFWYKNEVYYVIGVVKNYHFASLNEKIGTQLFTMKNDNLYGSFCIKIRPGTDAESLRHIRKTFKRFFPRSLYSYIQRPAEPKELRGGSKVETDHVFQCHTYHFHFMHWAIWFVGSLRRKENKGNWHTQSAGCFHK